MIPVRGAGLPIHRTHYGTLTCPHCKKEGVERVNRQQVTCGSYVCKDKQNTAAKKRRRELNNRKERLNGTNE